MIVFGVSIGAGLIGSLLGLGGGIIVVPALTLLLGLDIKYAIGASIIAVIATSSGSAASYVRQRMVNMRVGMLLEMATVTGALVGAFLVGIIAKQYLYILFSLVMVGTSLAMVRKQKEAAPHEVPVDRLANRLRLHSTYHDKAVKRTIDYRVTRTPLGLAVSGIAGMLSGLLGIGGGVLQVPLMSLGMNMPIKTSTATSNFMMGVTGAASAGVYFAHGMINPFVAAPVVAGILVGARVGARLLPRLHGKWIRLLFVGVLVFMAIRMFLQGFVMIKTGAR